MGESNICPNERNAEIYYIDYDNLYDGAVSGAIHMLTDKLSKFAHFPFTSGFKKQKPMQIFYVCINFNYGEEAFK